MWFPVFSAPLCLSVIWNLAGSHFRTLSQHGEINHLLENEAIKPIKSIHFWEANIITIPNMNMSMSVYRVDKIHIGCNIKNTFFFLDFYIKTFSSRLFASLSTKSLVIDTLLDTPCWGQPNANRVDIKIQGVQ